MAIRATAMTKGVVAGRRTLLLLLAILVIFHCHPPRQRRTDRLVRPRYLVVRKPKSHHYFVAPENENWNLTFLIFTFDQ